MPRPAPETESDRAAALAGIGPPVDTAALAGIATACARERKAATAPAAEGPGSFSLAEIARHLIPVAPGHLRRVLKANPGLPQGDGDAANAAGAGGGPRRFTLEEVQRMRAHLAAEGSPAKAYLPWRPAGLTARIVTVANCKGGSGKTTTVAHLAMAAALDGYRVLVIDLDGQGALTALFGGRVDGEGATVLPLLARHHARHLQRDNRARALRGETPQPLDATLDAALNTPAASLVQRTAWPGIDLIGAGLELCLAELRLPVWRQTARGWRPWEALGQGLADDGLLADYDIVFIDTPPALGFLTLGALAAAQILLVPTGATAEEFDATGRFFAMLHASFAAIEEEENRAARALGGTGIAFSWDAVRALITRYDATRQAAAAAAMQAAMSRTLLPQRQEFTPLIGAPGTAPRALYAASARGAPREARLRARASFDMTYAAFRQLLHGAWRRAETAAGG